MTSSIFTREQNPWFSFKPYQECDAHNFKGRAQDIIAMMKLIAAHDCVVCYAKSGIGKSSLINAGLAPRLRRKLLLPVYVRFSEDFFADNNFDKRVVCQITAEIERLNSLARQSQREEEYAVTLLPEITSDASLRAIDQRLAEESVWWWLLSHSIVCKRGIFETPYQPYIIFDQFEEFFYKARDNAQKEAFFQWLRTLVLNQPSEEDRQLIKELLSQHPSAQIPTLQTGGAKILISLREDFVGQLDYWCTQRVPIIALQDYRYCLMPLTQVQAEEVITEQSIEGERVALLDEYKHVIIGSLMEPDGIPAVLLSVLCNRIFDEEVTGHINTAAALREMTAGREDTSRNQDIDPVSAFIQNLVRQVYEERLAETRLSAHDIQRVEQLLVKDNGTRRRVELSDLPADLQGICLKLSDVYLVRIEDYGKRNEQKIQYAEIIHDRIADVIHERQLERRRQQQEKQGSRKAWLLRAAVIIAALTALCCAVYFGVNVRKNGLSANDLTRINTLELTTADTTWLNQGLNVFQHCTLQDNSLVEKFIITGDSNNVTIKDCYQLKAIEVRGLRSNDLKLNVGNCPQLTEITVLDRISKLDYSISGCPRVQIHLNQWVEEFSFYSKDESSLIFKVDDKNPNYLWRNNILWDIQPGHEKIIYAQHGVPSNVPFPPSFKSGSLWCPNLHKNIENSRQVSDQGGDTLFLKEPIIKPSMVPNRGVQEVFLGDSVKRIFPQAFKGCKQLRRVHFPKHRISIQDEAFAGCSSLDSVIFEGDSVYLGARSFAGCCSLRIMQLPRELMVDVPTWVTTEMFLFKRREYKYTFMNYIDNPFMECPRDFCPQITEGGNLVEEDGIIFLRDSHIPIFVKTDAPAYNSGDFFTDQRTLFVARRAIGVLCWLPQTPEARSREAVNSIAGAYYSPDALFLGFVVLPRTDATTITLPTRARTTYLFPTDVSQLQAIHIPYPQPEGLRSVRGKKIPTVLDFDLPDSIKERITLYVPVGSRRYYENSTRFMAFKAIREEGTAGEVYSRFFCHLLRPIGLDFSRFWFIAAGFPLLVLLIGWVVYRLHRRWPVPASKRQALLFAVMYVGVAVLLYVITVACFMVFTEMSPTFPIYAGNVYHIPIALLTLGGAAIIMFAPELTKGTGAFLKGLKVKAEPLLRPLIKAKSHKRHICYVLLLLLASAFVIRMLQKAYSPEEALRQGNYGRAAQLYANRFIKADTITEAEQNRLRSLLIHPLCIPGVPDSAKLYCDGYGGGEHNDFHLKSDGLWHYYDLTNKSVISVPSASDGFEYSDRSPQGGYRMLRLRKARELITKRAYSSSHEEADTFVLFSATGRRDTLWPVEQAQWLENERYLLSWRGWECFLFETATGKLLRSWKNRHMRRPLYDEASHRLFISVLLADSIGVNYYAMHDSCMVEELNLSNWKTATYQIQGKPAYVVPNTYSQTGYVLVTEGAVLIHTSCRMYEVTSGHPLSVALKGEIESVLCDSGTSYFLCNTQTDAEEYRVRGSKVQQKTFVGGRFRRLNDKYALIQDRDSLGWHFYQVQTGRCFPVPVAPVARLDIMNIHPGTNVYKIQDAQTGTSYLIAFADDGPHILLKSTESDSYMSGSNYFSFGNSSESRWGIGWDKDTAAVVSIPAMNDFDTKKRRFEKGFYRQWDERRQAYLFTPLSGKEDYSFYTSKLPWLVLDGWVVTAVDGNHKQLINVMSLPRLIKETTLLTDEQKQALLKVCSIN